MATLGKSTRVGAVMIVAFVLFVSMYLFFKRAGLSSHTYLMDVLFMDASGVAKGVDVQLAGVKIGSVDNIKLQGQQADLTLRIDQNYKIPLGSHFLIITPLLGNTGVVSVVPPVNASRNPRAVIAPGSVLKGDPTADLTASLSHAGILIDQVTITAKKVDGLIDQTTRLVGDQRLQNGLKQTLNNVDAASANAAHLTVRLNRLLEEDNGALLSLLAQTRSSSQVAIGNLTATTADVRSITHDNKTKINEIVSNLQDTTSAVAGITSQTNDLLKNGDVSKNLSATVANLKLTTDKLTVIADNFEKLSSDQGIQGDLKATVHNIRDTTEQTTLLLERLNKLAGTKPKTAAVIAGPNGSPTVIVPTTGTTSGNTKDPVPFILPRVDLLQNTRRKHFRADLDAFVPIGGSLDSFGRIGIYGFGDTNTFNLQYGRTLSPGSDFDYRAGLYASKLAVGADIGLNRKSTLSFDVYDPNLVHVDAHGILMFNNSLGLVVGAEDITRRASPVIGLEFRH